MFSAHGLPGQKICTQCKWWKDESEFTETEWNKPKVSKDRLCGECIDDKHSRK